MRPIRSTIIVASLGVLALTAASPVATATGSTYPVSVAGSYTPAPYDLTASSTGVVSFTVGSATVVCTGAGIAASPVSSVYAGASVLDLAILNKVTFSGCTSPPMGGALAVFVSGSWKLHGTGPATSAATDAVSGHLENITITLANAACQATVTGQAKAVLDESSQKLVLNQSAGSGSTLLAAASPAKPCLGKVPSGSTAGMSVSLQLSPGSINIG